MSHKERKVTYLLIVSMVLLFLTSVYSWRLASLRYDIGGFDVLLLSQNPLLTFTLIGVAGALLVISLLRKLSTLVILLSYVIYFYISFIGPYIANPPYYIHRDIFLHLPYSLLICESGHIPVSSERSDVTSYPASFIFYALYSLLTGIREPRELGLLIALLYPSMMAIILLTYTRTLLDERSSVMINRSVMLTMTILPFISRFAPSPGFPHRYHLAFIQATLLLQVFTHSVEKNSRKLRVAFYILYLSLIFTHPYFSFALAAFIIVYLMVRARRSIGLSVPLLFIVHSLYLTSAGILIEAYRITLSFPDRLMDFMEVSLPIKVKAVDQSIYMMASVVRSVWRVYIGVMAFTILTLYLYMFKSVKRYALSLGIACLTLIPILVASFLWWERSMTFIALIVLCAAGEIFNVGMSNKKWLKLFEKYALPTFLILSVIISPLIRWERPSLADNWQGHEREAFMRMIALSTETSRTYIGACSAVEYTYYHVYLYAPYAPNYVTIFDPVKGIVITNASELSGIYAVSVRDPDLEVLKLEEILTRRSVVWSSGFSYISFK